MVTYSDYTSSKTVGIDYTTEWVVSGNAIPARLVNIYVSNEGNDPTGNGSQSSPYATLSKVSSVLTNNTNIYLAKGSSFINDKLDLSNKSNINIDSYGTGDAPIITGLKSVSGWTNEGGNIWSKQDNNLPTEIGNVFIGGVRSTLGRVVATKTATGGSFSTLIDSSLGDTDGYWDNAELFIGNYDWLWYPVRITSYASKTFNFPPMDLSVIPSGWQYQYQVINGTSYIIQNHRNCLTTQNQWAYNNSTKTLYIYSTTEPTNVTATYGDNIIYALNGSIINIKNINLIGSTQNSIYFDNCALVNVESNAISYSGMHSIIIENSNYLFVGDNNISESNTNGIMTDFCNNVKIMDNIIDKCEIIKGYARFLPNMFGGQKGEGINVMLSRNAEVLYNKITNCSYDAISIQLSTNYLVQFNEVDTYNINRGDGAGIYNLSFLTTLGADAWLIALLGNKYFVRNTGGSILSNIILNGNPSKPSMGIYVDESTSDCEVAYNFISKAVWSIYSHFCMDNNIHDNIIYNIGATTGIYFNINAADNINNIINNNLIVNEFNNPIYVQIIGTSAGKPNTFSNNKYYYPHGTGADAKFAIAGITGVDGANLRLSEWKSDDARIDWNRDNETQITPSLWPGSAKPQLNFLIYLTNPAKTVRTVTAGELPYSDYVDMDGVAQTYPFTMQPYTAKVLVRPN